MNYEQAASYLLTGELIDSADWLDALLPSFTVNPGQTRELERYLSSSTFWRGIEEPDCAMQCHINSLDGLI